MRVLVTPRSFAKTDRRPLELLEAAGCEVIRNPRGEILSREEMLALVRDVDGIIVGVDPLDREVLQAAGRLRAIAKYGVGVDNIDMEYARERGIPVSVTRGANANAVADYAFALMLTAARGVSRADRACRQGRWERVSGLDVWGKTLGILGLGAIGRGVAARGRGFQMRGLAYDLYRDEAYAASQGIEYASLEEVLAQADFVSLHLPLTADTERVINSGTIGLMKPGAVLVNTARGGLVDEEALFAALREGRLAGAALDVFREEPPHIEGLETLENLVVSAHCAAASPSASEQMGLLSAQNLLADLGLDGAR